MMYRMYQSMVGVAVCRVLPVLLCSAMVMCAVPATAADDLDDLQFMRVNEDGGVVELQVAAHTLARQDGSGPRIALVGVAHIGERSLYRALQELLDQYDVVLYEAVLPPGAKGAVAENDSDRAHGTNAALRLLAGAIEVYRDANDAYPESLGALHAYFKGEDNRRIMAWVHATRTDGWGRSVSYERIEKADDAVDGDKEQNAGAFTLISLGADGEPGGDGPAADIHAGPGDAFDLASLHEQDGLQSQLARALGMEFQLTAMDYSRPNWRNSDMAMDQLERAMAARGADLGELGGTLAGTSFTARVAGVLLGLIEMADRMMDGALADTIKIMMIEMLGDEDAILEAMGQAGPGFLDVIIGDRNQVTMDDLARIVENEPEVDSVAIFYGAGHMRDFVERLAEQLDYREHVDETWISAMRVDMARSAMSEAQLRQMRIMVRRAMQQQFNRRN